VPQIVLRGLALHAGVSTSVSLSLCEGPSVIVQHNATARLDQLRIARADRGVVVIDADERIRVDLIEHLMAAAGAMSLESGLCIALDGPEVPRMDGGARQFALAMRSLGAASTKRRRRIVRRARVEVEGAVYDFEPSDDTHLDVTIDYDHPLISGKHAEWKGDPCDFVERIARARTYGFLSEAQALRATARARGANTRDVIVLCDDGTSISIPAPEPDECARHKLLDLIGDLAIGGGVPIGSIKAFRPGHRVTHEVLRLAESCGVFESLHDDQSRPMNPTGQEG
jgi:UDP-3-O-[3-hydroxymyristoyl] N-acetylglucosamine deacetylase